jgi:hypothetical protein
MVDDLEDFISLSYAPFSSEHKDRKILNVTNFAHELSYLLNQVKFHHELHDPIAFLMDTFFQKAPYVASLGLIKICSCNYEPLMDFFCKGYIIFMLSYAIYNKIVLLAK